MMVFSIIVIMIEMLILIMVFNLLVMEEKAQRSIGLSETVGEETGEKKDTSEFSGKIRLNVEPIKLLKMVMHAKVILIQFRLAVAVVFYLMVFKLTVLLLLMRKLISKNSKISWKITFEFD